jgi:alginate O-acetyltransferase complex protein AlgI
MVFSSSLFLFGFFPLFFAAYYLAPNKLKNPVVIICSLFFYAWGARSFVIIVLGTLLVDWLLGNIIANKRVEQSHIVRICVVVDVVMNIGLLLYFKYFNFFADNINFIFQSFGLKPFSYTKVLLPIGVSFVIFQKVTYCIDIARGNAKPAKNIFHLVEYMLLFPHIIAGPIVKYNEIAEQIKSRDLTWVKFTQGFSRFSIGLFKKVWIADTLAIYADNVFSMGSVMPWDYAWLGIVCYTFQIFFDFAAYSDMAIGLFSMMGFTINENFNMPYISKSMTEFWKRWHISLTSWFREYLYFPLGGSRKGIFRTYLNQWIVFLVSGFWHGASLNFIFWGAYHGTIICAEKAFILKHVEKIPKILRWLVTMLLIMIGWVFFRADTIVAGWEYVKNMFDFTDYYVHINPSNIMVIDLRGYVMLALAAIISFFPLLGRTYDAVSGFMRSHKSILAIMSFILFVLASLKIITAQFSPFIYFRF